MVAEIPFCFPNGKRKALILSYDDGSEHDRRLVALFNRYGLRGSFHLNSGKLDRDYHVTRREVHTLYEGHEVSCHTVNHPDLTRLPEDAIRWEIGEDRRILEDLAGRPVRGLAYPFGTWDQRVLSLLPELGIEYARTAVCTDAFNLPERFLTWETTCHHNRALELGRRWLEDNSPELALCCVWGHSFELDGFMSGDRSKNWDYLEAFCRLMSDSGAVYSATAIAMVDYLNALRRLEATAGTLINNAAIPIWIQDGVSSIRINPGEAVPRQHFAF